MRRNELSRRAAIQSILGLGFALGYAAPARAFETIQGAVEAPIELFANKILIDVRVNGQTFTGVYDSGAERSVLSQRAVAELGLTPTGGGSAEGFGGSTDYEDLHDFRVDIGDGGYTYPTISVIDFSLMAASFGRRFDFILGADLLRDHVIEIDPGVQHIRWTPRRAYTPPADAVELRMRRRRGIYTVPMTINGIRGMAGVDIGAGTPLLLSAAYRDRVGIGPDVGATRQSSGVGGHYQSRIGSVESAMLGGAELRDVPTAFQTEALPSGADINLGLPVLMRFRTALDYRGRRMWLTPVTVLMATPFERDMSGMRVGRAPSGTLVVLHVSDVGPAVEAGLAANDEIVAVDGVNITDWPPNTPIGAWTTGPEGATRTLTLADGRTISIMLRRYY